MNPGPEPPSTPAHRHDVKTGTLPKIVCWISCLLLLAAWSAPAAQGEEGFQAGVARVKITPEPPCWLSGYASRLRPATTVLQDLWAKALALRDPGGRQVVLVTLDLIGLPRNTYETVATQARARYHLDPSSLVLNCSHTHCGPAVGSNLSVMFAFSAEDEARVEQYTTRLASQIVGVIGEALQNLAPAVLATGQGSASFGANRRQPTPQGFRFGVNPQGPTDHAVPVLRVTARDGTLRSVLFGYACHNTTLGGDFYEINGDYAGYAQAALEQAHPGLTAQFLMLCGADQNPHPRGTIELARQHGQDLAAAVEQVLRTELRPVRPPLRTSMEATPLDFAPHQREIYEKDLQGQDKFRQRRARLMLAAYDQGKPVTQVPSYIVQAVRFHDDLTLLTLAGEVVLDYSLRAKREFPGENLIVAGYCNEVMSYIPSRRILAEGGYEAVDSMVYYGQPGPFSDGVEERVFASARRTLQATGAKLEPSAAAPPP